MINLPRINILPVFLANLLKRKVFYALHALIAAANVWRQQRTH